MRNQEYDSPGVPDRGPTPRCPECGQVLYCPECGFAINVCRCHE